MVQFPPQCCSFPFTLKGQLHYRCILGARGLFGCFIERRIWATCVEPNGMNHSKLRYLTNSHTPWSVAQVVVNIARTWLKKVIESNNIFDSEQSL